MNILKISQVDLMKDTVLDVKITRKKQAAIRIWVCIKLLQLGAWVLKSKIQVELLSNKDL